MFVTCNKFLIVAETEEQQMVPKIQLAMWVCVCNFLDMMTLFTTCVGS